MAKDVKIVLFAAILVFSVIVPVAAANELIVVNFDDLDYGWTLSGTTYAGLTWEWGNEIDGHLGEWCIPIEDGPGSYPYSEPHVAINGWGASLMGIGFPEEVDVLGAYFAGAGTHFTPGVRVHGYLGETELATTDWFNDINETPDWFAINLNNVDRIVIESIPIERQDLPDYSWYGMDDLTYVPEPATFLLLGLGGLLLRKRRR